MIQNLQRSEIELVLDGDIYILRPTFSALCRIEEELKTGLPLLAEKLVDGEITLQELLVIVTCCLAGKPPPMLGERMLHCGIASIIEKIGGMFAIVFGGNAGTSPPPVLMRSELKDMISRFS